MLAEKLRFLVAGGSTTLFSYALYAALLFLGMAPMPSYVIAYLAGILWSYLVNSLWVFKSPMTLSRFFKFPVVYVVQAAASFALFHLLHNVLHVHALIAPVLVTALLIPVTYILSKRILQGDPSRANANKQRP